MILSEVASLYLVSIGRSRREYQRLYARHISPAMGETPAAAIGVKAAYELHQSLASTPYQANRVLAVLSGILRHAERLEVRPIGSNPCSLVKAFPEKRRHRYPTPDEAMAIGKALTTLETAYPDEVRFIRLVALTGARPDELKRAAWTDVDGDAIVLDRHKTDRYGRLRVIYLTPPARALLQHRGKHPLICGGKDPRRAWERVREAAGCGSLRLYDLRHFFASAGLTAGASLDQIGPLLGQTSSQTTMGYAHLMNATGRQVAAAAADVVQNLLAGQS